MTISTVSDAKNWPLTESALRQRGEQALYVGDYLSFRFQYLDSNGVAVRLDQPALATITFEIFGPDGCSILRSTGVDLDGYAPQKQIVIDADQSVGDATTATGKAWYEVFFAPLDAVALLTVKGRGRYRSRVTLGGFPVTHLRGAIDVIEP